MAVFIELEARVTQIRDWAIRAYVDGENNMVSFGDDGAVVFDPDKVYQRQLTSVPAEHYETQAMDDYHRFIELLDSLVARFENYYDLGRQGDVAFGVRLLGGKDGSETVVDSPFSVYDRLLFADVRWMRPVARLVDEEDWKGDAATNFMEYVWQPFQTIVGQQRACTKIMAMATQMMADGVANARIDLEAIATACLVRLGYAASSGGLIQMPEGIDPDTASTGDVLASASTGLGIVGVFLPPPFSIVAGALSVGTGVGSMFATSRKNQEEVTASGEQPPAEVSWNIDDGSFMDAFSGRTTVPILESTMEALTRFEDLIHTKDAEMSRDLQADRLSDQAFDSPDLRVGYPSGSDSGSFGNLKVERGEVAVDSIANLYEAGYKNLPGAADQFEAARSKLAGSAPFDWVSILFPGAATQLGLARTALDDHLSQTHRTLTTDAGAFVEVAQGYELAETENDEVLSRFRDVPTWQEEARENGWIEPEPPPLPAPVGGESIYH